MAAPASWAPPVPPAPDAATLYLPRGDDVGEGDERAVAAVADAAPALAASPLDTVVAASRLRPPVQVRGGVVPPSPASTEPYFFGFVNR
jgi:hypothetical protein